MTVHPVVNANLVTDNVANADDQQKLDDILLTVNTDYIITHRSAKGFTLILKKKQDLDLNFSWDCCLC